MRYDEGEYVAPDADLTAVVGRIDVILDEEYEGFNVEERCRVVLHMIRLMNALR